MAVDNELGCLHSNARRLERKYPMIYNYHLTSLSGLSYTSANTFDASFSWPYPVNCMVLRELTLASDLPSYFLMINRIIETGLTTEFFPSHPVGRLIRLLEPTFRTEQT